jgi:toxin YoeB
LNLRFTESAARDLTHWKETNPKIVARIKALIASIESTPYSGIGKPEALKHDLASFWSRRIDKTHRLVYRIENDQIVVIQCRFHY